MTVGPRVLERLRRDYDDDDRGTMLAALEAIDLGGPSYEGRERIHAAMLVVAAGDAARLEDAARLARTDLRDLLVAAGFAGEDWRSAVTAYLEARGRHPVTPGWRLVSIGFQDVPVDLGGGVDAWRVEWTPTRRRIVAAHPSYPAERHVMDVHRVSGSYPPIVFAAGEFSNGVWGFLVPDEPGRRVGRTG